MTAESSSASLFRELEAFYRREILLLQDRRYGEWLQTMDNAVSYRVPVTTSTVDGLVTREDELGYYDEDLTLLKARVAKLESKMSWVEHPPSRLRYFVQVIDAHREENRTVLARSNLLLLQCRWNMEQQFSGERTDTLLAADDGFRIRTRRVVLDRQAVGKQGLSVFF